MAESSAALQGVRQPRMSALEKARRRVSEQEAAQAAVAAGGASDSTPAISPPRLPPRPTITTTSSPSSSPPRPISLPTHSRVPSDHASEYPTARTRVRTPSAASPRVQLEPLATGPGVPAVTTRARPTHPLPPIPTDDSEPPKGLTASPPGQPLDQAYPAAADPKDKPLPEPDVAPAAQTQAAWAAQVPVITKRRPTDIISPQPERNTSIHLLHLPPSPAFSTSGDGDGDVTHRSLPPTPHTPQSTTSKPQSTTGSAGHEPGGGDHDHSDTSSMARRGIGLGLGLGNGSGNGFGNGRLSPASAELRGRDVAFAAGKSPTPPAYGLLDVKKPTEVGRPQGSPHHVTIAKLIESVEGHHWLVAAVVLVGLTIVTWGWSRFFIVLALIVGPFIARYCIPIAETKVVEPEAAPQSQQDSVGWINHALRTLFPLISTDVLTPFVDLLEDALMQQVPPIVTSVRLTSVSLGTEPVLLTSMKPISDDQWFAALAQPDRSHTASPVPPKSQDPIKGPTPPGGSEGPSRCVSMNSPQPSSASPGLPGSSPVVPVSPMSVQSQPAMNRGVPSPVIVPLASNSHRRKRSASSASKGSRASWHSAVSSDGRSISPQPNSAVSWEGAQLRKRDRLLSRLKRHRTQVPGTTVPVTSPTIVSGPGGINDELEADHYVNYEVGFTYRRPQDMRTRGNGLHMIAHFGWGVRGVGGAEIPVYLDVGELRGKLRVRILLSASPPFAREISFSFVSMPEFDISARPMRSGSFNAMNIPLIKSYVEKSIAKVAGGFVSPKSYTMDIDRLLMGYDNALRTQTIGVFHVVIHNATNLPRTDTVGSCDPYLSISFSKFQKPLFSTRTIVDTTEPVWEEETFILVPADAIAAGEKLRLRVCDSDRFSADDLVGVVEVDVADMIEQAAQCKTPGPFERHDLLKAISPGMKVQGEVEWSIRFYPVWQMPHDELERRVLALRTDRRTEDGTRAPWWLEWLDRYCEVPQWEKERAARRQATIDFLTGERMRDEIEAAGKPTADLPAGVLQFHIHQCVDLELESLQGTFSASSNRRKSAASGKPALQDVIDRGPADNYDPPSAYCEVHINDKFVYRTRTKQLTPVPYFNAASERFIRDWRVAKIVFVVKDQRDREHDPIMGVVSLRLKDVLKNSCQVTHWYPLVGGLGWGRLRISLLFKPFDMHIPQSLSSYETATFDMTSISTTTDLSDLTGRTHAKLVIETEYDRAVLHSVPEILTDDLEPQGDEPGGSVENLAHDDFSPGGPMRENTALSNVSSLTAPATPGKRRESVSRIRDSLQRRRETISSSLGSKRPDPTILSNTLVNVQPHKEGEIEWHAQHPVRLAVQYRHSCSVLLSFVTKRMIKKPKVHAIATLRLNDCADGEVITRTVPIFATASVRDAIKAARQFTEAQKFSGADANGGDGPRVSHEILGGSVPLVGYAKVSFVLHPGVSRAHRKLARRDLKFRSVYNAWEATRTAEGVAHVVDGEGDGQVGSSGDESSSLDGSDLDSLSGDEHDAVAHAAAAKMRRDDTRNMLNHRAHSKALHSRNRGIFQLKLARTGKLMKDKVEAKLLSSQGGGLDRRARGADQEVEHEGQSHL